LQIKTDKTQFHGCTFVSFFPISVSLFQTLDNLTSCYYGAVGGFFGASERGADSTSFEAGNKSGLTSITASAMRWQHNHQGQQ
jgi:hypothetical protein